MLVFVRLGFTHSFACVACVFAPTKNERGIEALEEDRKHLALSFQELQQLKYQELQQRRSEIAPIESNVASPMLEWIFVDRPGQLKPRYTVQV